VDRTGSSTSFGTLSTPVTALSATLNCASSGCIRRRREGRMSDNPESSQADVLQVEERRTNPHTTAGECRLASRCKSQVLNPRMCVWSSVHQGGQPSRPRARRLRAKHALGLALEAPRVMPCHIALPEISETFGQSGHITHLLAGEAASHAAGAEARRCGQTVGQTDPFGSSCRARCGPAEVSVVVDIRSAGPGIWVLCRL
jgi:hypothetical protein